MLPKSSFRTKKKNESRDQTGAANVMRFHRKAWLFRGTANPWQNNNINRRQKKRFDLGKWGGQRANVGGAVLVWEIGGTREPPKRKA